MSAVSRASGGSFYRDGRNLVGFALIQAQRQGIRKVTLVGMMGKFSKVAQGVMMVHSKSAPVDFGFLAQVAIESEASYALVEEIRGANTASQVGDLMAGTGNLRYFERLCERCNLTGLRKRLRETGLIS